MKLSFKNLLVAILFSFFSFQTCFPLRESEARSVFADGILKSDQDFIRSKTLSNAILNRIINISSGPEGEVKWRNDMGRAGEASERFWPYFKDGYSSIAQEAKEKYISALWARTYLSRAWKNFGVETGTYLSDGFYASKENDSFYKIRQVSGRQNLSSTFVGRDFTEFKAKNPVEMIKEAKFKTFKAPQSNVVSFKAQGTKIFGLSLGKFDFSNPKASQLSYSLLQEKFLEEEASNLFGVESSIFRLENGSFVQVDTDIETLEYNQNNTFFSDLHRFDFVWGYEDVANLSEDFNRYFQDNYVFDRRKFSATGESLRDFFVVSRFGGLFWGDRPETRVSGGDNKNNLIMRRSSAFDVAVGKNHLAVLVSDYNSDSKAVSKVFVYPLEKVTAARLQTANNNQNRIKLNKPEQDQNSVLIREFGPEELVTLIDFDSDDNLIALFYKDQDSFLSFYKNLGNTGYQNLYTKIINLKNGQKATHMAAGKGVVLRDEDDILWISKDPFGSSPDWKKVDLKAEGGQDLKAADFSMDAEGNLAISVGDGNIYVLSYAQLTRGSIIGSSLQAGSNIKIIFDSDKLLSLRRNYKTSNDLRLTQEANSDSFKSTFTLKKEGSAVLLKAYNEKWIEIKNGFLSATGTETSAAKFLVMQTNDGIALQDVSSKKWVRFTSSGIKADEELAGAETTFLFKPDFQLANWKSFLNILSDIDFKSYSKNDVELYAYLAVVLNHLKAGIDGIWAEVLEPIFKNKFPSIYNLDVAKEWLDNFEILCDKIGSNWQDWRSKETLTALDKIADDFSSSSKILERINQIKRAKLNNAYFKKFGFVERIRELEATLFSNSKITEIQTLIQDLINQKVRGISTTKFSSLSELFDNNPSGVNQKTGVFLLKAWLSSNKREAELISKGFSRAKIQEWILELENFEALISSGGEKSTVAKSYIQSLKTLSETYPFVLEHAKLAAKNINWLKQNIAFLRFDQFEEINLILKQIRINEDIASMIENEGSGLTNDFVVSSYKNWSDFKVALKILDDGISDVFDLEVKAYGHWFGFNDDVNLESRFRMPQKEVVNSQGDTNDLHREDLAIKFLDLFKAFVSRKSSSGKSWSTSSAITSKKIIDKIKKEFKDSLEIQRKIQDVASSLSSLPQFKDFDISSRLESLKVFFNQNVKKTQSTPEVIQKFLDDLSGIVQDRIDFLEVDSGNLDFSKLKDGLVSWIKSEVLAFPAVANYVGKSVSGLKANFYELSQIADSHFSSEEVFQRIKRMSQEPVIFDYFIDYLENALLIIDDRLDNFSQSQIRDLNRFKSVIVSKGGTYAEKIPTSEKDPVVKGFVEFLKIRREDFLSRSDSEGFWVEDKVSNISSQADSKWVSSDYLNRFSLKMFFDLIKNYKAFRANFSKNEHKYPYLMLLKKVKESAENLQKDFSNQDFEYKEYEQVIRQAEAIIKVVQGS